MNCSECGMPMDESNMLQQKVYTHAVCPSREGPRHAATAPARGSADTPNRSADSLSHSADESDSGGGNTPEESLVGWIGVFSMLIGFYLIFSFSWKIATGALLIYVSISAWERLGKLYADKAAKRRQMPTRSGGQACPPNDKLTRP